MAQRRITAEDMERNSQVLELILKRKTTAFDNGIDVGVRESEESEVIPPFWPEEMNGFDISYGMGRRHLLRKIRS